ncbi:MAG: UDP-N-acetylmuramoyl-L-alanyl-D-glutamate--2,6-diaminopimelate ligase [Actinomycetota bacterium]|nr:UDP-N-acetylmuramoyl-L-alanyl-D-glutamate--2,6-diaminopimelate ligase [Actinomycetota bacterium]
MRLSKPARDATLIDIARALTPRQAVELVGDNVAVDDVHIDSRSVTLGSLFVAIRGATADGHDFLGSAAASGATAVAVEKPMAMDLPYLLLEDTRSALGWIAAEVHGYPGRELGVIGITGTNGKTTVAHMLATMTAGSPRQTAVIGTVSANLGDTDVSPRTTPEANDLHRILRHLVDAGQITDVAIEVSSHAMVMGRVNGVTFDVVAFTNLSQDHLDYHDTMEDYYQAKARLFQPEWAPHGVVWIDDSWGNRLAGESSIPVTTVGTAPGADVIVAYGRETPSGSRFTLNIAGRALAVEVALAGRFNISNAAVAIVCAHLQEVPLDRAISQLATMPPIPGRYNTLDTDRDLWVVVDYAHTPDAIESVILESRQLIKGRIIAVVGAGGDRDRRKRPLMGAAIATADIAIITTDNPRSEDPGEIIGQMVAGVPAGSEMVVEPDRRAAIRHALTVAHDGDAVLILGKGHEAGQEFADGILPFDDRQVAEEELQLLAEASG